MTRLEIVAITDTGRVREANEDAHWTGHSVVAVADGMGGHAAGEVASAIALEPVASLDGKIFPDARAARQALSEAVLTANAEVVRKAAREPTYRGMGTTLTAAMFEGRRVHVAHVGDSRAYLLRHGELVQLTTDHTLVQHLIDEGELAPEEAASHPHRSVVTRAIGVSAEVEVDSLTIDLRPADQLLLCSDGLTGVVDDEEIARTLLADPDAPRAVRRLVEQANEAGGPDNITIVLLRVHGEEDDAGAGDAAGTAAAGEAGDHTSVLAPTPVVVRPDADRPAADWAQRLGRFGQRVEDPADDDRPGTTTAQRLVAAGVAVAILAIVMLAGGRWLLSRSYYVGLQDDAVVIYQGIPGSVGPVELSWVSQETQLRADDVPEFFRQDLADGIPATDLADALRIVENAPRAADASQPDGSGADGTAGDGTASDGAP